MFENALRIIQVILKSMKTLYFLVRMLGLMCHKGINFGPIRHAVLIPRITREQPQFLIV